MSRFLLAQVAIQLSRQDGVVARRQLIEHGAAPHDIARLIRRRELTAVMPGIYVIHNGPLTPRQQQWVAVLTAWPAALTGRSALPEPTPGPTHLVVGPGRQPKLPPGTKVRRSDHLHDEVLWHRSPPRVRIEHAVIDVMSSKIASDDVAGAFHALADAAHPGDTDAERMLAALERRPRVRGRTLIRAMLHDLRDGACSVLEREYLHSVERAHGLPRAERQRKSRATGGTTSQDLPYPEFGFLIELDGGTFHRGAQSDTDAFRDLAELARARLATVRVTYGLVFGRPCLTARMLAEILQARGWDGAFVGCYRCRPNAVGR